MASSRRRPAGRPTGRPGAAGRPGAPRQGGSDRSRAEGADAGRRGRTPRRRLDGSEVFQVGRRPSSPLFLMVVGVLWVVAGVVALFGMHAGWRVVPAIVFVGIGLYFVRGSSATILRRQHRRD